MQLRRDAEDELAMANFKIHIAAHFYNAYSENGNIVIKTDRGERHIPMLREESGKMLSLSDFVIPAGKEKTSAFGVFAISVKPNDAHEEGCCCPACSNKYEDLVGRTVRMTVAEAASCWLDNRLKNYLNDANAKIIKPAAGYASWYAPVAVELPEDYVEAWYFKGDITKVGDVRYAIMAPIGGNVVPANTGVILKDLNCNGKESNTYELTITTEKPDYADKVKVQNKLEGTVATEYVADGAYVLSKPNGKEIGFYQALLNFDENYNKLTIEADIEQYGKYFQNNSHKAYLPASNLPGDALQSAGFRFSFGGTTDIEEVETESSEVNAIYDLTGRKLEGISGAGIYIINGKKVLIK
jgi:hypothetical protein